MKKFLLSFLLCLILPFTAEAEGVSQPETLAKEAVIVDFETGAVLYDKNADIKTPTSSMSKVMTAMVVFDAIRSGKLSLEQT
ncbi:MAG: D-alanyl-D-alanine carboxypeptidase, partial [Alphaproteobacteria bacterium]|nr:D-alanyl-D-alanine carboxypeptidase [Alphaproteobacteria bacterium]